MKEEQFDINHVEVAGTIKKIWSHGDLDIWLRLEIPNGEMTRRITLRIPDGMIDGEMIPLQNGEIVAVSGILVNSASEEFLTTFLENAKIKSERIAEMEDTIGGVEIKRMSTRVDVLTLEKMETLPDEPRNSVMLSGLVINTWTYNGGNYARLAIYDKHTKIVEYQQPFPKREAHYVTVQSQTELKKKHKIRGQGQIVVRLYRETVSEVVQKLRLDSDLTDKELDAHTIKPSVYADLKRMVMFG